MRTLLYSACLLAVLTASNFKSNADLETAKRIIALQDSLIKEACEHDAEFHACDCPYMDTDKPVIINELKSRL